MIWSRKGGAGMYKISYVADGVTTEYQFVFPFFQNADVRVAIDDAVVVPDAGIYSVVPNNDFTGGSIVFQVPPTADVTIDIFRRIALNRVIDYQPTMKIDPESLNADFNFLLAAFRDLDGVNIDLAQWKNTHDNVMNFLNYNLAVIQDKLSGGAVLGLYQNLLSVLDGALPKLVNDYGMITDVAPNENRDDYGVL